MTISKIKKFHIFAHISIKESLLSELQKLGCVEIINIEEREEFHNWNSLDDDFSLNSPVNLSNVKFCIDLLSSYRAKKSKGLKSLLAPKKIYSYDELVQLEQQYNFQELFARCKELDNELNQLNLQENRLNAAQQEIQRWLGLDLDLSKIEERKYIKIIPGSITKNNYQNLVSDIEQQVKTSVIKLIAEEKNKLNIAIIILKENQPKLEPILQKYFFEIYKYSHTFIGTPKQIIKTINEQLHAITGRREEIRQTLIKLYSENQFIYPLYDLLSIKQEKEDTKKYLKKSAKTIAVRGWIQEKDIPKLEKRLKENFSFYDVSFSEPKEGEVIPIVLSNKAMVRPFEIITELYSLPDYHTIDPTPILSIFYFVFFGLALSDVGYGGAMALMSYLAMKYLQLGKGAKKFFNLLYYCGVAGILGGILLGSWFGDILNYLPPVFNNLRFFLTQKIALFNPVENPIPLLILSLILGVIQIYTGILIKFTDNVSKGKLTDGIMDQISWLVLITGIILYLVKGMLPSVISKISGTAILIGTISIILTQGRAQKNILLKIGSGILALYGITGYLSDFLSYSRLFALGLATGIIAQMFNMLATMIKIPYLGVLFTLVILIVGHTFNLFMSGLGAFIHDARLQYVEFFSKFYDAGGNPFRPFTLKTTYIEVEDTSKADKL